MDIGKAFGFMFKDPKWGSKMIIFVVMVLASMILVGIPFVIGYMVLAVKNVAEGRGELPEWNGNWEKILTYGFRYIVIAILLGIVGALVMAFKISALNSLWNLISMLITPLVLIKVAVSDEFGQVFDVAWYTDFLSRNFVNLVIVAVMQVVFGFIAAAGVFALVIGVFFTAFYAMAGQAYLLGELYRVGSGVPLAPKSEVGIPAPVPTPEV